MRAPGRVLPRLHQRHADIAIDILIPFGRGSRYTNAELRYALRAIERHAQGYGDVVVVGEDPGFLQGRARHLGCPEANANKAARIAHKLRYAIERGAVGGDFALWADDYVLLRDIDVRELKPFYVGPLGERAPTFAASYGAMMRNTERKLDREGLATLDYDAHAPVLVDAGVFAGMGEWWEESASGPGLLVKSAYFNVNPPPKLRRGEDARITGADGARVDEWAANRWVLSCSDGALAHGLLAWLRARFPERSAFERT